MTSRMRLVAWRPLVKNTLRGFADVELPIGLTIREVHVHCKNDKLWAALPSRPQIGADGQPRLVDGKLAYSPILEWRSQELRQAFSARVIELVRESHPADLEVTS